METMVTPPVSRAQFASDNATGICPEAWEAMAEANRGAAEAYGEDSWTKTACDLFRELFETDCDVFFTFNGTASNSLALASLCQSYHSIICHELAHVETDECVGPEFFSNGTKILLARGNHGKVGPAAVEELVRRRSDVHYPKPKALSLTQATELGTVYTVKELEAIHDTTRGLKLHLHMDGARFANAMAFLQVPPKDITWKVGVDVLCFGGSKNGLAVGEAVIFFNKALAQEFDYRCKQAGQLSSKMRFLSAPWVGLLKSGTWLNNAEHANRMARLLESQLRTVPGVELLGSGQANAVFVKFPPAISERLQERGWKYYAFVGAGGSRLMCSWSTKEEDIHALMQDIKQQR